MKNEFGDEVPDAVAKVAIELGCAGGAKYVYRKGDYRGAKPAASIGVARAIRFRSKDYLTLEIQISDGWVAFRSPGTPSVNGGAIVLAIEDIPPLPSPRVGQVTDTRRVDGTRLHFIVRDGVCLQAPSNPCKAFLLQKVQI